MPGCYCQLGFKPLIFKQFSYKNVKELKTMLYCEIKGLKRDFEKKRWQSYTCLLVVFI